MVNRDDYLFWIWGLNFQSKTHADYNHMCPWMVLFPMEYSNTTLTVNEVRSTIYSSDSDYVLSWMCKKEGINS